MAQDQNNGGKGKVITIPAFSNRARRLTALLLGALSVAAIFLLLTASFYKVTYYDENGQRANSAVRAIDILRERKISEDGDIELLGELFTAEALILFIAVALLGGIGIYLLFSAVHRYSDTEKNYYRAMQAVLAYACFVCGAFYLVSIVCSAVRNASSAVRHYDFSSGINFWFCFILAVLFAFLTRYISLAADASKPEKTLIGARTELFIYGLMIAALAVCSALGDILYVSFDVDIEDIYLNGLKALLEYTELDGSMQLLVFFVLALVAINASLFLLSLTALAGRSRFFYQITLAEIAAGSLTTLLIGLFGKYFAIAQQINSDILDSWISYQLELYGFGGLINPSEIGLEYDIMSPSHWYFLAALGVLCVIILRKPYSRGVRGEERIVVAARAETLDERRVARGDRNEMNATGASTHIDHDPCPAFTEIDRRCEAMRLGLEEARASAFEAPTLPRLVDFVVNYARDSRLHLYYSAEDIAAFIAGLGTTRLTILQGMSGTGKTSLPKIFAEAIFGGCEIVEVESSWRDKNELLGYYNEFSRIYTPKKFTTALYRASLFPERPTFIVLDEMNLSRVEYYFSDLLSIMENEEDRRELKLLGVPIYPTRDGIKYSYMGISEGTTLMIPKNVWFIGTANRDESTFEISDKVYDRAHTMNFNKRAPKLRSVGEQIAPRFMSTEELRRLFAEAERNVHFDIDSCAVVSEVEALLAPYNISFGNRIANQIESFVRIYAACFGGTENAVAEGLERILLSKVISKLELKSPVDKDGLAAEFERLGLMKCRDFVLSLNED